MQARIRTLNGSELPRGGRGMLVALKPVDGGATFRPAQWVQDGSVTFEGVGEGFDRDLLSSSPIPVTEEVQASWFPATIELRARRSGADEVSTRIRVLRAEDFPSSGEALGVEDVAEAL